MCVLISYQLLLLSACYLESFVGLAHVTNTHVVGMVNHSSFRPHVLLIVFLWCYNCSVVIDEAVLSSLLHISTGFNVISALTAPISLMSLT